MKLIVTECINSEMLFLVTSETAVVPSAYQTTKTETLNTVLLLIVYHLYIGFLF
jgi:hypothetical protein